MVKKKFLELSRKHHPDFFVNESLDKQNEVLELATVNTKAFQTLSDFDKRMKYILELKQEIHEGERYELPPDFLMEMMEINEGLMELQEEQDAEKISSLRSTVAGLFDDLYKEVSTAIESYKDGVMEAAVLKKIKDYYYKKKYLLRIQQSLDTFATHS